jgi:hypothetical protein
MVNFWINTGNLANLPVKEGTMKEDEHPPIYKVEHKLVGCGCWTGLDSDFQFWWQRPSPSIELHTTTRCQTKRRIRYSMTYSIPLMSSSTTNVRVFFLVRKLLWQKINRGQQPT